MFDDINVWAPVVAAVVAHLVGWFWYSPKLFGKMSAEGKANGGRHGAHVHVLAFIAFLISAFAFAVFLGSSPDLETAIRFSLFVSIGWIAMTLGINYLYSGCSLRVYLIDAFYYVVMFLIYAVVIGLWHS